MAKKQVSTKKVKKKKWFPVIAPTFLSSKVLGESLLAESSEMKGRFMTMNLMNITGDPKKQTVNLQFRIKNVREGQGITEVIKYELLSSAVKRLIRRGRSKVDDSFIINTAEGKIIIKTLTITNGTVFKSIQNKLRMTIRGILKEVIPKNSFEKNVEELLRGAIQKDVKNKLSKITPMRTFNVRVLKRVVKDLDETEELVVESEEVVEEEVKAETPKEEVKAPAETETSEKKEEVTKPKTE